MKNHFYIIVVLSAILIQTNAQAPASRVVSSTAKNWCIDFPELPTKVDSYAELFTPLTSKPFSYVDLDKIGSFAPPFTVLINVFWRSADHLNGTSGIFTLFEEKPAHNNFEFSGFNNLVNVFARGGNLCLYAFSAQPSAPLVDVCAQGVSLIPNKWYTVGLHVKGDRNTDEVHKLTLSIDGEKVAVSGKTDFRFTYGTRRAFLGLPPLGVLVKQSPAMDDFRLYHGDITKEQILAEVASPSESKTSKLYVWFAFDDPDWILSQSNTANTYQAIGTEVTRSISANVGDFALRNELVKVGSGYVSAKAKFSLAPDSSIIFANDTGRRVSYAAEAVNVCYVWGDPHVIPFDFRGHYTWSHQGWFNLHRCVSVGPITVDGYASHLCGGVSCIELVHIHYSDDQGTRNAHSVQVDLGGVRQISGGRTFNDRHLGPIHARNNRNVAHVIVNIGGHGVDIFFWRYGNRLDVKIVTFGDCYNKWRDTGACSGTLEGACLYQNSHEVGCQGNCEWGVKTMWKTYGGGHCPGFKQENCWLGWCPCVWGGWNLACPACWTKKVVEEGGVTRTRHLASGNGGHCGTVQSDRCGGTPNCPTCEYQKECTPCTKFCNSGTKTCALRKGISGPQCPNTQDFPCNTHVCPECVYLPWGPFQPICNNDNTVARTRSLDASVNQPWCTEQVQTNNEKINCDVDECAAGTHNCFGFDDEGSKRGVCTNVVCKGPECFQKPTFTCSCPPGFKGDGQAECKDVNECLDPAVHQCDKNANCINTIGSFLCRCRTPLWIGDGKTCEPNCQHSEWSPCEGNCEGIGKQYRKTQHATLDVEPKCAPLVRDCQMGACPAIIEPQCQFRSTQLLDQAKAACGSCIVEANSPQIYADCLFDICVGDDVSLAAGHCTINRERCILNKAAEATAFPLDLVAVSDQCPPPCLNMCNGRGKCTDKGCECNPGFTGLDCRNTASYRCLDATWNNVKRTLSAFVYSNDVTLETTFADSQKVGNSILVYLADAMVNDVRKSSLYIINDRPSTDANGGEYSMTIAVSSGDLSGVTKYAGPGSVFSGDNTNIKLDSKWAPFTKNAGAALHNLPAGDFCVTITVALGYKGINQLLIGTGDQGAFDVMKVPVSKATNLWESVRLCSRACTDTCSNYVSCSSCAADPNCGWCRDAGECMAGNPTGPSRGECRNWRFTFDTDTSRRLSVNLAYPVLYDEVDVWLTTQTGTKADLPLHLSIDAANPADIIWNIIFAVPSDDALLQTVLRDKMNDIINEVRDNAEIRHLAIASYSAVAAGKTDVGITLPLLSVHHYVSSFTSKIPSTGVANPTAHDAASILNSLGSPALGVGWRENARRAVVYFSNQDHVAVEDLNAIKVKILESHLFPIFLVNPKIRTSYDRLVDQLEFGLVKEISEGNLGITISSALDEVAGTVAMIVTEKGHIIEDKKEDTFITGLSEGQRARFTYVFHEVEKRLDVSSFISPGFGTSVVENVESDIPKCENLVFRNLAEDATHPRINVRAYELAQRTQGKVYAYQDYAIRFVVVTLPTSGKLFQYSPDSLGPQITQANTPLSDPSGKFFYVPDLHSHSVEGKPFASFSFLVNDFCVSSPVCTAEFVIDPVPDEPIAKEINITILEDTPGFINPLNYISDFDRTGETAYELVSWALIGPNTMNMLTYAERDSIVPREEYTRKDQLWASPPLHQNGYFNFLYRAQDPTARLSQPSNIHLTITPVNDPPEITVAIPITVLEDVEYPITIEVYDPDSAVFFLDVTFPPTWKALSFKFAEDNSSVLAGGNDAFKSEGDKEERRRKAFTFLYTSPKDGQGCKLDNITKFSCNESSDIYTYFYVSARDGEGSRTPSTAGQFVKVDIIVVNVNDPPSFPSHTGVINMTEDTPLTEIFTGDDVDKDILYSIISNFPSGMNVSNFDNTPVSKTGDKAGYLTDPNHRAILVPDRDMYGDPNNNWNYATISYQIFDGQMYSDSKLVQIRLLPVNDPPISSVTVVSTNEDTPAIVPLSANDPDNAVTDIGFNIVEFAPASDASFFAYDATKPNGLGALINGQVKSLKREVSAHKLDVTDCVVNGQTIKAACFVFLPASGFSGKTSFTIEMIDTDRFDPKAAPNIVRQQITVEVAAVNDAPIARMNQPYVLEDVVSVIKLDYSDDESDPVEFFVTSPPTEGKLYQFSDAAAQGNVEGVSEVLRNKEGTKVTDAQGRLIYVPPKYKNSETELNHLNFFGTLQYFVAETTPKVPPAMRSADYQVDVFIAEVNNAPYVWGNPARTAEGVVFVPPSNAMCFDETCKIPEDLNTRWPERVTPAPLYFGGDDIEKMNLQVIISSWSCDKPTTFFVEGDKPYEIVVGQPLPGVTATSPSPQLTPLLYFVPCQDCFDYTCTFVYNVRDPGTPDDPTVLTSVASKKITFAVTPVNDAPRAPSATQRVVVIEDTPKDFSIIASDPEGDVFSASVTACDHGSAANRGTFSISNVIIDCDAIRAGVPQKLPGDSRTGVSWVITYVPPPDQRGTDFHGIDIEFDDGKEFGKEKVRYSVTILSVNDPPTIAVVPHDSVAKDASSNETIINSDAGLVFNEFSLNDQGLDTGIDISPWNKIFISDKDAGEQRALQLRLNYTAGAVLKFAAMEDLNYAAKLIPTVNDVINGYMLFELDTVLMNHLLNTLTLSTPSQMKECKLVVTVNDLGHTGGCPVNADGVQPDGLCPMEASLIVHFNQGEIAYFLQVASIAGPALIGVALVGLLAGAAAFQRVSSTAASPEFQPWNEDVFGASNDNVLYETALKEVRNDLYVSMNTVLDD